jgi:cation-transporting ATPase 13A3/4/5
MGSKDTYGLVTRTGFITSKGGLVRDILYPRPNNFKFYRDSMLFVLMLGIIAVIGFLSIIKNLLDAGYLPGDAAIKCLDLITITVPPILPSAMTMGTVYSISRLKSKRIFCIAPPKVNVAGRVNLMVFDKTGTLTEDGL